MRPTTRGRAAIAALLVLAGCSGAEDAPGLPTRDEDRQLNEAAAMLDANSVALEDAPDNGTDPR